MRADVRADVSWLRPGVQVVVVASRSLGASGLETNEGRGRHDIECCVKTVWSVKQNIVWIDLVGRG